MNPKFLLVVIVSLLPSFALAEVVGPCAPMTLRCLVAINLYPFVNTLMQFMISATVVFFMWNVFLFVKNSDQPEELEKFKSKAVWGIIALAVMASVWGLVTFITSSVGLDNTQTINVRTGVY